jgi:hypothetical protein
VSGQADWLTRVQPDLKPLKLAFKHARLFVHIRKGNPCYPDSLFNLIN